MTSYQKPCRIGLLGGGQLARMLALCGHRLGFEMHVLSPHRDDPAAQVVSHHHLGELHDPQALRAFLTHVDVATFESEFLDSQLLSQIIEQQKKTIFPHPHIMGVLQDRLTQKELLKKHHLPTLDFTPLQGLEDTQTWLAKLQPQQLKLGFVIKKRRFGYDGYGTFHIHHRREFHQFLKTQLAPTSASDSPLSSMGFIAEPKVAFQKELAICLTRSVSGQIVEFPLVETHQKNSRCEWVKGPVQHSQLKNLTRRLHRFLHNIDYVGTMAFELFEVNHQLIINEIAPRVHNSAHYSLDALTLDQFSAHLLALVDAPLATPTLQKQKSFAMVNLLGVSHQIPKWIFPAQAHLHWYGKLGNRPGRKMGHLTCLHQSSNQALRQALLARKKFKL